MSIQDDIRAYAQIHGVDPRYALAVADRESSFDPDAHASKTIHGLFQMSGAERDRYGMPLTTDVGTQVRGFAQYTKNLQADMANRLGRTPTPSETYLAHYWGPGRAAAVLNGQYRGLTAKDVFSPDELAINKNLKPNAPVEGQAASILGDIDKRYSKFSDGNAQSAPDAGSTGRQSAPEPTQLAASPGRQPNVDRVHPLLLKSVAAGAATLPPGYRVTINEGFNPDGHAEHSQHHIAGSGALDVQIWGPDGKPISNRGNDTTGMYEQLARGSYYAAQRYGVGDQFAWGGRFGTVTGGNVPDLMHFDLGGDRGHIGVPLAKRFGTTPQAGVLTAQADPWKYYSPQGGNTAGDTATGRIATNPKPVAESGYKPEGVIADQATGATAVDPGGPANSGIAAGTQPDPAQARQKALQSNFERNQPYLNKDAGTDYATKLDTDQEAQFRGWVKDNKVPFNPDATGPQDYDMRGYWKGLQDKNQYATPTQTNQNDGQQHWPDYWKTPYHETFSKESQWADPKSAPAWNEKDQLVTPDGNVVFDEKAPKPDTMPTKPMNDATPPPTSTFTPSDTPLQPPKSPFTPSTPDDQTTQYALNSGAKDTDYTGGLADLAKDIGNQYAAAKPVAAARTQSDSELLAQLALAQQAKTPVEGLPGMPGQKATASNLPGANPSTPAYLDPRMFGFGQPQQ